MNYKELMNKLYDLIKDNGNLGNNAIKINNDNELVLYFDKGEIVLQIKEEIKSVKTRDNQVEFHFDRNEGYDNKKGILEIEYVSGKKNILDLESMNDLTSCNIGFKNTKKTKENMIFNNIFYNDEEE